jgi:hypothetical protein
MVMVKTLASCAPTAPQHQTEANPFLIALRGDMRCQIRRLGIFTDISSRNNAMLSTQDVMHELS